jgi:hypothetical protein
LWHYIEPIFLTLDGISLFGNTISFDYVNEDIWHNIFVRFANAPDQTTRIRRLLNLMPSVRRLESNIQQTIPPILKEFETKSWRLLYWGARDVFAGANFHSKCDEQSHTVTIILMIAGYIFGGFTPIAWDSTNSYKADNTGKIFVFSLKNPRNAEPEIFQLSNVS